MTALAFAEAVLLVSARRELIALGPLAGMPRAFRLTVACNVPAGTPFFPGATAVSVLESARAARWPARAFAIATENSDVLSQAFDAAVNVSGARAALFDTLLAELLPIDAVCKAIAESENAHYVGCDPSIASAADPKHSVFLPF